MVCKRTVAVVGTLCGLCGVKAFMPMRPVPTTAVSKSRTWINLPGSGDYDLLGGAAKSPAKPKAEYDLLGGSTATDVPVLEGDPNDALLAELVFSTEDVRELIYKRLDECNDQFVQFLEDRINASSDLDERSALRSLVGVIDGVKKAVEKRLEDEEAARQREEQQNFAMEAKLNAEVEAAKKRTAAEQAALDEKKKQIAEEKRMQEMVAEKAELDRLEAKDAAQSYEQMLEAFMGLDYSDTGYVMQVVEANYERCTIEFLDILGARLNSQETSEPARQKMGVIRQCIENIMQTRMAKASEKLAQVIKAGTPNAMIDKVYEMAKEGQVDEPLILLLEANQQQARNAGAAPAAELFKQLLTAAREAIDETLTPARRLIRRLLRVEGVEERKELLGQAFRPKVSALLADGSKTDNQPDVPPPEFIEELQVLIKNFGNVEEAFREKLTTIVAEAEEVSIGIYGKPMSIKEQQDYMWSKATMSVFDLEQLEGKAQQAGDMMPWQNDKYDAMLPPGFEEDGTKRIGGGGRKAF